MWYEPIVGMLIFGVITMLLGYASGFVIKKMNNSYIPIECSDWNKHHVMEKTLFVTGMLTWLVSYGFAKYSAKI